MKVLSLDFETYYGKELTVKTLGPVAYARKLDPIRDIYWIALQNNEGWRWAGHPGDMDDGVLSEILSSDRIVSHNAAFDSRIWLTMAEAYGMGEEFKEGLFEKWDCTSDMASCLGAPRSLAGAAFHLLKVGEVSKDVRSAMKGKRFNDLSEQEQIAFKEYAFTDTDLCLRLELEHGERWNELERWLSRHTRLLQRRGISINRELCSLQLGRARELMAETEAQIPWSGRRKVGSRPAFFDECEKVGIKPPLTTDKKSQAWQEWLEIHGDALPWAKAISQWRAVGRLIPILEHFIKQSEATGRFPVSLMYYGGHTGRWSGTAGVNLQNLNRSEIADIQLRHCLQADPGKRLVIADFAAIEAVVSFWLAGETTILDRVREGMGIYEAFARSTGVWTTPENLKKANPALYQHIKVQVLGLQYGMGPEKFQSTYRSQTGEDISMDRARSIVGTFRNNVPGLIRGWNRLQAILEKGAQKREDVQIPRPGGNIIHYAGARKGMGQPLKVPLNDQMRQGIFEELCADYKRARTEEHREKIKAQIEDVKEKRGAYSPSATRTIYICPTLAKTLRNGQLVESRWWGGSLWENLVQGTARDILAELLVDLESGRFKTVLHVHDEVVVETEEGEETARCIQLLESWPGPDWAKGCPIKLEIADREGAFRYSK